MTPFLPKYVNINRATRSAVSYTSVFGLVQEARTWIHNLNKLPSRCTVHTDFLDLRSRWHAIQLAHQHSLPGRTNLAAGVICHARQIANCEGLYVFTHSDIHGGAYINILVSSIFPHLNVGCSCRFHVCSDRLQGATSIAIFPWYL